MGLSYKYDKEQVSNTNSILLGFIYGCSLSCYEISILI